MKPDANDLADRSGDAILKLLQQAADVVQADYDTAIQNAHNLSIRLRDCQDRVGQLEIDRAALEERAIRAERWLDRLRGEIEEKFPTLVQPAQSQMR